MGKGGSIREWITPVEFQELAKSSATPATVRGLALRKEFVAETKSVEGADRTIQFRISTGSRDRDRDTINPMGWDTADYLKNPVVLFAHDYASLPIAKAVSLTADRSGLIAVDEFTPPDLNPFGDCVYRMIKGGFLNATSVGFRPLEWVFNEQAGGVDFAKQSLLEHSVVPVPANSEALVEARSAGIDIAPLKAWAEEVLDRWHAEKGLWLPKSQVEAVFKILNGNKEVVPVEAPVQADEAVTSGEPENNAPNGADGLDRGAAVEEKADEAADAPIAKRGRVLSGINEGEIRGAIQDHERGCDRLRKVLAQLDQQPQEEAAIEIEEKTVEPVTLDIDHSPQPAKEEAEPIELPDPEKSDTVLTIEVVSQIASDAAKHAVADAFPALFTTVFNRLRGRVD